MATDKSKSSKLSRPPATTPEARENQLVKAAVDLAEKQLLEGTASAQVISHYLKMGSSRERLEQRRLEEEIKMQAAKTEFMESQKRVEAMYGEALAAMRSYSGQDRTEVDHGADFED